MDTSNSTTDVHFYLRFGELPMPDWAAYTLIILVEFWQNIIDFLSKTSSSLFFLFVYYVIFGFLCYVSLSKYWKRKVPRSKRVLIVIAHPDDEVMFFGPTIVRLIDVCQIHLLCLSSGNMHGEGAKRKKELWESCRILGIPASNITMMDLDTMPDNPHLIWNVLRLSRLIHDHIEALGIQEVYTFDVDGVSGHKNHTSIFFAFARLCLSKDLPDYCQVYFLNTLNKVRKYSAFVDSIICFVPLQARVFVANCFQAGTIRKAMRAHRSQLVWYRRMYIWFSTYIYINTYTLMEYDDVEFIMQLHYPN